MDAKNELHMLMLATSSGAQVSAESPELLLGGDEDAGSPQRDQQACCPFSAAAAARAFQVRPAMASALSPH